MAVTVQAHGLAKMLKLKVIEFNDHTVSPQHDRKVSGPLSMLAIAAVVMALAIMQKREPGEYRRVDIKRGR
jgi:hypothetical protein